MGANPSTGIDSITFSLKIFEAFRVPFTNECQDWRQEALGFYDGLDRIPWFYHF
jgi:hypothetical protein